MVKLSEDQFGLYTVPTTGKTIPVRVFTWENDNKISLKVITYGATITSLKVPNKNGIIEDIVTGFDDLQGKKIHKKSVIVLSEIVSPSISN